MSKQHSKRRDSPPLKARGIAERLRLLYSWQESLAAQSGTRRGGAARRAAAEIAATRKHVRAEIERRGEELQRVFQADQQRPGNLVIQEKLGQLRHQIQQLSVVLKARSAAELGGFIELPLEHYPVELGLGRSVAGIRFERDDFITLVVAAIIIVISCLTITWYHLWREDVAFGVDQPGPDRVAVHFQNDSSFVAHFYGPWPESEAGLAARSYGVRLYCRPAGGETFQDCTSIRDVWRYQGQPISPLKPIQVETGVAVTIHLRLDELERVYGAAVEAVRIECGNRGNQDDFSYTLTVD